MITHLKFLMFSHSNLFLLCFVFPGIPTSLFMETFPTKFPHPYTWPNTQVMTDLIISFTLQCDTFILTATAAFHKISHYACSKSLSLFYDMFQIFSSHFSKSETTCHTHETT